MEFQFDEENESAPFNYYGNSTDEDDHSYFNPLDILSNDLKLADEKSISWTFWYPEDVSIADAFCNRSYTAVFQFGEYSDVLNWESVNTFSWLYYGFNDILRQFRCCLDNWKEFKSSMSRHFPNTFLIPTLNPDVTITAKIRYPTMCSLRISSYTGHPTTPVSSLKELCALFLLNSAGVNSSSEIVHKLPEELVEYLSQAKACSICHKHHFQRWCPSVECGIVTLELKLLNQLTECLHMKWDVMDAVLHKLVQQWSTQVQKLEPVENEIFCRITWFRPYSRNLIWARGYRERSRF
jgi:hypothetical protein